MVPKDALFVALGHRSGSNDRRTKTDRRSCGAGLLAPVLTLLVAAMIAAAPAWAVTPSTIDETAPAYGRSAWTYQDLQDVSPKYEGGYAQFESTAALQYVTSPHGGYDTTTNHCKVCHAVHRSSGAYSLMRGDSRADACSYCHVGGSAHSQRVVYDATAEGVATTVGHTIGASSAIPASSVETSMESIEVSSTDASGTVTTETASARRADAERNRIFSLQRSHSQSPAGSGPSGYLRVGPTALTCLSCHEPHNATSEVWRPPSFPSGGAKLAHGYKLLKARPSGSIFGPDDMSYGNGGPPTISYTTQGMKQHKAYTSFGSTGLVNADNTISAPETTLTPEAYGPGKTIWTSPDWTTPTSTPNPSRDAAVVTQFALSVWCADCHNLAIGNFKRGAIAELGAPAHESTPHPAPFTGANNGPAQCYTCHRADLSPVPTDAAYDPSPDGLRCERCHYGTGSYAVDSRRVGPSPSDFPHSADTSGTKMLGAWSVDDSGSIVPTAITSSNVNLVCLRCHKDGAKTH